MTKMLLVVDPQVDFISGTLPVPDAEPKMKQLVRFVREKDAEYAVKVVTTDWHPYDHCSFKKNGGQWPMHCVQNTEGAKIFPMLADALSCCTGVVEVLRKGTDSGVEEYSVFKNAQSAQKLNELLKEYHVEQVDLCGIAGDVCVLNTLKDGIELYGGQMFKILTAFCPSLDGGKAIFQASQACCK